MGFAVAVTMVTSQSCLKEAFRLKLKQLFSLFLRFFTSQNEIYHQCD